MTYDCGSVAMVLVAVSFLYQHVSYVLILYKPCFSQYTSLLIIRPPIVLVESGLNSEQVSLMSPIYIEKCILELKQRVFIAQWS